MSSIADHPATTASIVERVVIAAGAALAIVAAAWSSGAFGGTPVQGAAGGVFAADSTLLAPATPAFGVWSIIYGALIIFAVVQALPGPGSLPRVRAVARPLLVSMLLNAAWLAVVQRGWNAMSVVVIAGIVTALGFAAARLARSRPTSIIEAIAADATVGLYLGWATVATVANITAVGAWWLGSDPGDGMPAAVGVLIAASFIGIAMARDLSPSPVLAWTTTATFAWGLAWIGEGRLYGQPADAVVGWTALACAAAVVVTAAITTVATQVRALRWVHRRGQTR